MKTKICKACNKRKTLEMFVKDKSNESGRVDICYICQGIDIRLFEKERSKKCKTCKKVKPLSAFSNNRYGKISICRNCYRKRVDDPAHTPKQKVINFKLKKCLSCEFLINTKNTYHNKVLSCSLEKLTGECEETKTIDNSLDSIKKNIAKL